jgi:hypothetical protein
MEASSRIEERMWEHHLDTLLHKLLKRNHQDTIDAALDHAFKAQSGSYDALMESVEAASESCVIEQDGITYNALLIAVPILAWTRFSIASGDIAADTLAALSAHLSAQILAPGVRVAMAPTLFAIDQLPRTHAETFTIVHEMTQAALKDKPLRPLVNPPETAPFLADTRYLLAIAVAPEGEPLFSWQSSMNPDSRADAAAQWKEQALPHITRLLPGCGIELVLPEAYFVACREADKQIRPVSLRAAVHYLVHTLGVDAHSLQAIIGGFGEDPSNGRIDEYRIGFSLLQNQDVLYGAVWPLYGQEDDENRIERAEAGVGKTAATLASENKTLPEEILMLLRECGITHVKRHEGCFPMESCEDCGAPLYLDLEAELVHPEMPEDTQQGTTHFH